MHVCVRSCELAMFCVEILMYNISLYIYIYIYIYIYVNDTCNFIFTHQ